MITPSAPLTARFFSRAAAGFIFLVGALALLGWALDVVALKSVVPGFPPMVPNTAVGFALGGVSLWLLGAQRLAAARWRFAQAAGFIITLIGALTLIEYALKWQLPIDQLLFPESVRAVSTSLPGRVSPLSAMNFLLLGLALLLSDGKHVRTWFVDTLIVTPTQISLLALIGYACGVPSFYGRTSLFPNTAMALHTAVAFTVFGFGLLCARPERGLMKILLSATAGGVVARRLLLAPVIIPLVTGLVRIAGQRAGFHDAQFAMWFFSFLNIFIFTVAIWWIATLLHSMDMVRRRTERDLHDRTAELEAANRELEAFSYSVSHDLRAPLRAVSGFSSILVQQFASEIPDDAKRLLKEVNASAQEMGRLIDGLLEFSRLGRETFSRQPVAISALVRDVIVELRKEQGDRDVEIRVDELPDCIGDPFLLKQVFVNLLSNALKFTRHKEKAVIEVGCRPDEREAVYFVRDNGAGFDMKYAEKLFGVFQRLHRSDEFEGTGVGLSIVQRIIHRHGGRIRAEAEVNKGATFYFALPQAE